MREKRKLKQRNQTRFLNLKVQRTGHIYVCLEREVDPKTLVGRWPPCWTARLEALPTPGLTVPQIHYCKASICQTPHNPEQRGGCALLRKSVSSLRHPSLFKCVQGCTHATHRYTCTYVCTQGHTCLWLSALRDIYRQLQMAQSPTLCSVQTQDWVSVCTVETSYQESRQLENAKQWPHDEQVPYCWSFIL